MSYEDELTRLVRPDSPDYVSDIPQIEREFLRRLIPMLRIPAASTTARDLLYPRLGLNDAVTVPVPSEGVEYQWDTRQWTVHDLYPKSFTPTWTSGAERVGLSIGNGTLTGMYQRRGHTMWWRISLQRGTTTNLGAGEYGWKLPFPQKTHLQTGSAIATSGGSSPYGQLDGVVGFADPSWIYMLSAGQRVGTDSLQWSPGGTIILEGVTQMGGLV